MTVMSETPGKGQRGTVVPIGADTEDICSKLARILRALCKCPECCSVCPGLQSSTPAVLGTIQIMVGVINIGLGLGRTSTYPGDLVDLGAPYWLGAVYILAGILCIFTGDFPSACLVGVTVAMNIIGAIFAITGITLYAINLYNGFQLWMSDWTYDTDCDKKLLTTMDILLIVLAVLQLCVNISFAVLGINALVTQPEREEDVEEYECCYCPC